MEPNELRENAHKWSTMFVKKAIKFATIYIKKTVIAGKNLTMRKETLPRSEDSKD